MIETQEQTIAPDSHTDERPGWNSNGQDRLATRDVETETTLLPEIVLPVELERMLQENTRGVVDSLASMDPETGQWTRRDEAPSVVMVMGRSGTLAATGILHWWDQVKDQPGMAGLQVVELNGLGLEIGHQQVNIGTEDGVEMTLIGDPFADEDMKADLTDQDHMNRYAALVRHHIQTNLPGQVQAMARVLQNLPEKVFHELKLIDDVADSGTTSAVNLPIFLQLAIEQAGLDVPSFGFGTPKLDEDDEFGLINQYWLGYEHLNLFDHQDTRIADILQQFPQTELAYFPWASWLMMTNDYGEQELQWHSQVVRATIGQWSDVPLTPTELGALDEWLRGGQDLRDESNRAHVLASRANLVASGRPETIASMTGVADPALTGLIERGMSQDQAEAYLTHMSDLLRAKVIEVTTPSISGVVSQ